LYLLFCSIYVADLSSIMYGVYSIEDNNNIMFHHETQR